MDKLSKLEALLGENQVAKGTDSADSPWTYYPKPKHLYEGTDSEDDEDIMREGRAEQSQSSWKPSAAEAPAAIADNPQPTTLNTDQLELGQQAAEGESFCPWQIVKKYPFQYIGITNRFKVAENFFGEGKVFNQTWDFFYLHRLKSDPNQTPILLVPTKQVETFLDTINRTLNTQLLIPFGGGNSVFQLTFENDGTPRPRYLGQSTNKEMAENLRATIPPNWFKPKREPDMKMIPSERSLAAFKAKINLAAQAQKGRKIVSKEKQKTERIAKQQSWSHSTKRVQRYLGLRQAKDETQEAAARVDPSNSNHEWGAYAAAKTALPRSADFDPFNPAPYGQEGDVVFVCIDVEANERNSKQITEVGIATLDTRDLKSLVPGEGGANWIGKIRARHFRINEYKHIVNSEFVSGCPDRFEFGGSEFVNLRDSPQLVASCFKPPFSNPDAVVDENEPKRNIILIGHSVLGDIQYLKDIGYDLHNLSNLQEIVDTALMWQSLKRETNPQKLGGILAELDIAGWNLHNAGNDAVYTLQAMISISVKQLYEREKRNKAKEQEKKARVAEFVKEATQNAMDREEVWSSGGENSDGGAPNAPVPAGIKKPAVQQAKKGSQYREGPWRAPAQNSSMNAQSQRPAAVSGNRPLASNDSWRRAEPKSVVQVATLPTSTTATSVSSSNSHSMENADLEKRRLRFEKPFVQGPTLPGPLGTTPFQPTTGAREIDDLVNRTKRVAIKSKEPQRPPEQW